MLLLRNDNQLLPRPQLAVSDATIGSWTKMNMPIYSLQGNLDQQAHGYQPLPCRR